LTRVQSCCKIDIMEKLLEYTDTEENHWSRADIIRMLGITGMTFRAWVKGSRRTPPLPTVRVRMSLATKEIRVLVDKKVFRDWLRTYKPNFYNKLRELYQNDITSGEQAPEIEYRKSS